MDTSITLTVYIENQEFDINQIPELHLMYSLDSLLYSCVMKVRDNTNFIEASVKYGTSVTLIYKEASSGKTIVNCPLQVLSYSKITTTGSFPLNEFQISLTSPYYFSQKPIQKAYYGSVSSILEELSSREFFFKKKDIESSTDTPSVRYQIRESNYEFMKKIAKYAIRDATAMFLYSTIKQDLILKSIKTIMDTPALITLIPLMDSRVEASNSKPNTIGMFATAIYGDGLDISASQNVLFTTAHTVPEQVSAIKASIAIKTIIAQETVLARSNPNPEFGTIITGWEVPYYDAISQSINNLERQNQKVFSVVAIVPCLIHTNVTVGSTVKLYLNDDKSPENGTYYVKHIDHQLNDSMLYTKLHLIRIPQ